jgi:hypothetical protein
LPLNQKQLKKQQVLAVFGPLTVTAIFEKIDVSKMVLCGVIFSTN